MSDVFSIFNAGHAHLQRQRDLEKVLVVDAKKGGTGPQPLDLESGSVTIAVPAPRGRDTQSPRSNDAIESSFEGQTGVRDEPDAAASP